MSFQVEIKGIDELRKKLGNIADVVAVESIKTGIFAGTKATQESARDFIASSDNALTPEQREAAAELGAIKVGGNQLQVQTGRLQNSILTAFEDGGATGLVYSNVEYARIHELGGYAGKNKRVLIPARPYLTPALYKNFKETLDFIKKEFVGRLRQLSK